ncbi:MAG TPA: hypothetical protein VHJ58_15865 [Vicinamibacterales bacterium]|nr:hypothetical protein [Vicinamibacterales bacterium]
MNSDAEMLQAMEHLADQIDRLAAMLDECVTLTRAGVPIRTVDRSVCRGAGAVDTRAGGAARNARALLSAHQQDGRAVMFVHPAPGAAGVRKAGESPCLARSPIAPELACMDHIDPAVFDN